MTVPAKKTLQTDVEPACPARHAAAKLRRASVRPILAAPPIQPIQASFLPKSKGRTDTFALNCGGESLYKERNHWLVLTRTLLAGFNAPIDNKREQMDAIADVSIHGQDVGEQLGGDELFCVDFNGDDYKDIVVGAYQWFHCNKIGRAYLYYGGRKDSIDAEPDKVFTGDIPVSMFGHLIGHGDFNNDKYVDFVAGAWGHSAGEGRAFLYYGGPGDSTQLKFDWDTANASPGKHTLRATIAPIEGEEDTADNTMTVEVEVKAPSG